MRSPTSILSMLLASRREARAGGARACRVPLRWLVRPRLTAGDRVCLFVLVPRDGAILPHSADLIRAWQAVGYKVVVIAAVPSIDADVTSPELAPGDGFALRLNHGYDFGAWAAAIVALARRLRAATSVVVANDSVLGPSTGFAAAVTRAEQTDADVIGLVENHQVRHHLQSFTLFFKSGALRSRIFWRFWRGVRSGDRQYVIDHYETMLLEQFTRAGLRGETLFGAGAQTMVNPTLNDWKALVDAGFPFIKVQLFRDNPSAVPLDDWRGVAARAGFDVKQLDRQIAALKQHSDVQWAI